MANEQSYLRTLLNQDGAVILNTTTSEITTLNSTGALIWQGLQRGETLDTIVANLADETGEHIDSLKRDVRDFMDALNEQGLVSY